MATEAESCSHVSDDTECYWGDRGGPERLLWHTGLLCGLLYCIISRRWFISVEKWDGVSCKQWSVGRAPPVLLLQLLNYFCLPFRWRRRWGRRQIPRRGPPSALDVPIPLSRRPLPPPASLPGTSHGQLSPEPPFEENTLWPRENCTHRWLWWVTKTFVEPKSISSESYFTTQFVTIPCYCSF